MTIVEFFNLFLTTWWGISILCVLSFLAWFSLSALFYYPVFKRFYDIILSFLAIIILFPVFLLLILLGAIAMKGNPFFVQKRPGKNEKIFSLVKFRTMTNKKETNGNLLSDEKRLTRYGKFLRSTSLDELPEIFNIFLGQMSIVGPRPLLVEYLPRYNKNQKKRHSVRPGLTGLAQVKGRNSLTWTEKFEFDICYVNSVSFFTDLKIIFLTLFKIIKRSGIAQDGEATVSDFEGNIKKTPYFDLSIDKLRQNVKDLKDAVDKFWPNSILGYSYKTNSLKYVIDFMKNEQFFAEVVSDDEYCLAKSAGYSDSEIIFNGPVKSRVNLFNVIKAGGIVNLDSMREVNWLCEATDNFKVGLRVNYDIEKYCPGESACGSSGGRFGFNYENGELLSVIKKLKSCNIGVEGLHFHTSSKTRSLKVYSNICKLACEIVKEYVLDIKYLDIGGGFFNGVPNKPIFNDYLEVISAELQKFFEPQKLQLILEPGISLVGSAFDYVCSVINVKETSYGTFCTVDGSRIHSDPLFHRNEYVYTVDSRREEKINSQTICGFTCMENDRITVLNDEVKLAYGDKITFKNLGAYTISLSPLFIQYFPTVYATNNDGDFTEIREKWTTKEYLQKQNGN